MADGSRAEMSRVRSDFKGMVGVGEVSIGVLVRSKLFDLVN